MFFRKKNEKIAKLSKEKHERERFEKLSAENENLTHEDFLRELEEGKNEKVELEKGDLLALILSAFLVFSPVFIVLIIILVLVW